MPLYLTQFSYTPQAWAALVEEPHDREAVVRGAAEQFGCRLVFYSHSLGDYDGLAIIDAPDEATISAYMLAAIATGSYQATKTTVLIAAGDMVEILRKSAGRSFPAPGR